ncbi:hypothetical protein [Saccharothrix obliqua]|uniref:hypothetical protein n=1 Tax=Saccharothrix obliqua TaxID=2861747 RepID=UPI001C5DC4A1|nr:hypothetical protein [Saccharothrix obliqua]MBW4716759.1 hypothetical protein [Saccharothrix obliqua]
MGLGYCVDTSAADWLVRSRTPWPRLITFGPTGFEAHARLRFIPDPVRPGQAEADVDLPDDHLPDLVQARHALRLLSRFTGTPEECYFCVWDGYSDVRLPAGAARVELPHRQYALLRGALRDFDGWAEALGTAEPCPPPAFAWPADRSWCFTADVDPHWAGIGASRAAVDALVREPGLDVVPASPGETPPAYS